MKFNQYQSRPVVRLAFQLTDNHEIQQSPYDACKYAVRSLDNWGLDPISFKTYEKPEVGGWVVRLTEEDTYYCSNEVFQERNIVPEMATNSDSK
jgi:hypothetical protein